MQAAQEFVQENLAKAVPSGDDRAVAEFLETRGAEVARGQSADLNATGVVQSCPLGRK